MAKKIAVKNKMGLGKVSLDDLAIMTAKGFAEVATKTELSSLRTDIKTELNDFRTGIKTELNDFRAEVNEKFAAIMRKLETVDQREEFVLLEKRVYRLEKAMALK